MIVHIVYYCPECGGQSFRPSAQRFRKDALLRLAGIQPFRCHVCRNRFYLFHPGILRSLLSEPARSTVPGLKPLETPPPLTSWDT